ncbi:hypothetical protein BCR36DRAFT_43496 [Piromyces finnis]|uniref:Periplasmic binding protein-like II n=1 Tax=Piromyces finnis TaxID=1754191 RepID=A0A1Y1U9A8_9FUNG|nr:hypothetical protein BCR36DRAFT_43496 [Piromyces finnis]|eukprot:ORX34620.1 hypothetical protein BCR36DRAFT_43496 [Piromyces finnis]
MYYNIIFLLLCFIALTKAITINIVVQSFFSYSELYQLIINDFNNRYVKENNLDIKLKLNLFTEQNSTIGKDFYSSTIDTLLNKKSHKYDVFIYDPLFTRRYAPYFIDLKKYLPKEIIDSYSSDETINSGYYKDQCVGLPVYVKYKLLYSNINLLNKYNRTIPETWDELVETTKIVLEGERATNNNDLIGFSNLFPKKQKIHQYLNLTVK